MSNSAATKELPATSIWHGVVSDEDVALVRRRHAEKVEEWLDFADFVTELNALHEKYGVDKGEAGYFAYRKHLRTNYYQKLETYGPTPDPLDEGCDCIFCKMHPKETTAEPTSEERDLPADTPVQPSPIIEPRRVRCADQPADKPHHIIGPHSGPYATIANSSTTDRLRQVPAEAPTNSNQHNAPTQSPQKPGLVPAYDQYDEDPCRVRCADQPTDKTHHIIGPHSGPYATITNSSTTDRLRQVPAEAPTNSNQHNATTQSPQKPGPVPAYDQYDEEYEKVAGDTSRYDSVDGVEPDWGEKNQQPGAIVPIYPLNPSPPPSPYATERPTDADRREERQRREKKYGPDPVYVKTAGEIAWLEKMSGSAF